MALHSCSMIVDIVPFKMYVYKVSYVYNYSTRTIISYMHNKILHEQSLLRGSFLFVMYLFGIFAEEG
jgi:hypothetical protein